jgi:dTDP-4-dehydrorhamnose 3,5-epimerase
MRAPMVKLVRCTAGAILDVAVDVRIGSPTYGRWVAVELNADNMKQLLVPVGFAHGFATLSDFAEVQYKCSIFYAPETEGCIAWNDPDIGISWPFNDPIVSKRDAAATSLQDYSKQPAFVYGKAQ